MKKFFIVLCSFVFMSFCAASPFKLNLVQDSLMLGTGAVLYGSDLLADKVFDVNNVPYEGQSFDLNEVNAFDRTFMQPYSSAIDTTATVLTVTSLALPGVLAFTTEKQEWLTVAVMYAESFLFTAGLKDLGKLCLNRTRPYMYFDDWPEDDVKEGDWDDSFPSGHTSFAFCGASFLSYVFCKYNPGSKWCVPVIAGSSLFACSVAVLRVAAGCHFPTDVLTGALIGTACGILVPFVHSINVGTKNDDVQVSVIPNGLMVNVAL